MNSGVGGWYWSKDLDPMTDEVIYRVIHRSTEDSGMAPWIGFEYSMTKDDWSFGFMSIFDGDCDITYRIDKEDPVTFSFRKVDEYFYTSALLVPMKALLKCKTVTMRWTVPFGLETHAFAMRGFAETIRMVGLEKHLSGGGVEK
jgi:hypothetical protein